MLPDAVLSKRLSWLARKSGARGVRNLCAIYGLCALIILGGAGDLGAQTKSERLASPQDDPIIAQKLFEFSLAFELKRKCSAVKARPVRAYFFYANAYARAKKLGFSKQYMDDYIDDKTNQAAMQKRVDSYLRDRGVDLTKEADYCAFSEQQITDKTASGRLLRIAK